MYKTGMTFELKPGCYGKYKKAHDDLWPEMAQALSDNHVDMAIYNYGNRLFLFATAPSCEDFERSHQGELAARWSSYMATLMITDAKGDAVVEELDEAFTFGAFKTA